MHPERAFQFVAEQALARNQPLTDALAALAGQSSDEKRLTRAAQEAAARGDLPEALHRLNMDPLVVAAARRAPAAVLQAAAALRRLPQQSALSWRAWMSIPYLGVLALVVAISSYILSLKVLPLLQSVGGAPVDNTIVVMTQFANASPLALLPLMVITHLGMRRVRSLRWVKRPVLTSLESARVAAVAGALVEHGVPAPEALTSVVRASTLLDEDAAREFAGSVLDAPTLNVLSHFFSDAARQGAERLARWTQTVGLVIFLAAALAMTASVYLRLAQLSHSSVEQTHER